VILVFLLMASYGATSLNNLVERLRKDTSLAAIVAGVEHITNRVLGYYSQLHEIGTLEQLVDRFVRGLQDKGRFESSKEGVLALDDSTMRKFGKHMENISIVFDHCDNLYYLGYVMVSTCYADGDKVYPVNFEFRIQTEEEKRRAEDAKLKSEAEVDFRKKGALGDWIDVLTQKERLPGIMSLAGALSSVPNYKLADERGLAWVAEAREQLAFYHIGGKGRWSREELRHKTLANKPDVSEFEGLQFFTKEVSLNDYDREVDFVIVQDFAGETLYELVLPRIPHQQRVERILKFREREGDPEATKLDIGVRLLTRAKQNAGIKAETVAADAWYFVPWFVRDVLDIPGIKRFVSRLKSNQLVTYKDVAVRVDELWNLSDLAFRHDRKNHYKWATITTTIEGLGPVRLALVHELDASRAWRTIAQYVLVCTDPSLSVSKIVSAYKLRWGIEVFYRTAKQRFSLTEFHSRPFVAIHFHVTFVILAYLMTAVLRQFNPALLDHTLGEVIDEYLRCLVSIKRRGQDIVVMIGPGAAALFGLAPSTA